MKKIALIITLLFSVFKLEATELHFTFTNAAREKLDTMQFGEIGDTALYAKVAFISNSWFRPLFTLVYTEEQWAERNSMNVNCVQLLYFPFSNRFGQKVQQTEKSDDLKKLSFNIDTQNLTSPDLKFFLFSNHDNFRDHVPGPVTISNVTAKKLYINLDYDQENGFMTLIHEGLN